LSELTANPKVGNTFGGFICPGIEKIDGEVYDHVLPLYESKLANEVIHGEKSTSVGSDRMDKIALILILICTYVLVTVVSFMKSG